VKSFVFEIEKALNLSSLPNDDPLQQVELNSSLNIQIKSYVAKLFPSGITKKYNF